MSKVPEHLVTNNPYGFAFYGPASEDDTITEYQHHTNCGYDEVITKNGNKGNIVPGSHYEHILGEKSVDNRKLTEEENVSKLIRVENGDLVITVPNGNIKLKAQNVYIEASGSDDSGSFLVSANEAVTIVAGEQMTFGGAKICMTSTDTITLNSGGFINFLCKDINKGGPFSNLPFIPGPLQDLLNGITQSCK